MHVYKSEQAINVPRDLSLTQFLNSTARSVPESTDPIIAKDDIENRTLTLAQLRTNAGRLAAGLTAAFRPRDQSRWAVILPNSVAYIEACHAVLWLGGVFCPINHLLTAHELGNALAVCRAEYVIVFDQTLQRLQEGIQLARKQQPGYQSPKVLLGIGQSPAHPQVSSFTASASLPIPKHSNTDHRIASIHLSSGTTGNSKGVALTHYNYIANCLQMYAHDPDRWSSRHHIQLAFTPLVHIANTTIPLFLGPWVGMTHIIMAKFEMEAWARMVEREKVTATQCTPAIAVAIATAGLAERYNLGNVRHMVVGGLPLTKSLYEKFLSKGSWKTIQLYGMTEAAPYVTWQKAHEELPVRGQLGKLLPGMQARLVDAGTGKDVDACGGQGELWIRGPNVTKGYVDNPSATSAAFRDADGGTGSGWYNTGDVCTFSPEGYLTVVGRTKELIKVSGFQVAPTELEGYLNGTHPAMAEVAVGPVVDKARMTELPAAFVVFRPEVRDREDKIKALKQIQNSLDGKVSGYKKLKGGVWEVTSLTRTSTGKFVRNRLGEAKTGVSSFDDVSVVDRARL